MRNIVFAINVSIDGHCDHTLFNPDDEVLAYFTRLTLESGTLLYGRKTYELMVPYWPEIAKNHSDQSKGDIEFAKAFISVPEIVVFSKTLTEAKDKNTTIIGSDVKTEIQKLKRRDGKSILVGGVSFASELLELELIDELHIVIHPAISAVGRAMFDSASLKKNLQFKLKHTTAFKSGCIALHYLKE